MRTSFRVWVHVLVCWCALPGVTAKEALRRMPRSSEAAGRRLYFSTALSSSPSACVRLFTSGTTESFSQLKCRATDKGMGGGERNATATWTNTWACEGVCALTHSCSGCHRLKVSHTNRVLFYSVCACTSACGRVLHSFLYSHWGRGTPARSRRQALHINCAALLSIPWHCTFSLSLASRPLLDDGTCACTLFLRPCLSL